MTTPEQPASLPPALDVLGSPEPAARSRRRSGPLAALVGVGALAVAGTAVAAASLLGGGGAQPEDVLPADAFAVLKVDLDPAPGQKVAVYRLSQRFPSLADRVRDQDEIKDSLLSALFDDVEELDYARDVAPWIGDRVAIAAVPGSEEPQPLAAVAYENRAEAEQSLDRLAADQDELFYAFSGSADYVLLGSTQASVDAAAGAARVLADVQEWKDGEDALDGDQIVTAWADLGALWASLPVEAREQAEQVYGLTADVTVDGLAVAGLSAADDHLELVGRALDVTSPLVGDSVVGAGKGGDLVQGLPADTVAALSVTGLGAGLQQVVDAVAGGDDPLGLVAAAEGAGLTLPDDLGPLLGDETVLAALSQEDVGLRVRSADPDASFDVLVRVAALAGLDESALRRLDDGYAAGTSPAALEAMVGEGGLGQSAAFRDAAPDAGGAGYVVYVDVAQLLELVGVPDDSWTRDLEPLQSVGITGSSDGRDSAFRARLTVRE